MHPFALLHKEFEKELPFIHKTRLNCLSGYQLLWLLLDFEPFRIFMAIIKTFLIFLWGSLSPHTLPRKASSNLQAREWGYRNEIEKSELNSRLNLV
jgi:hypothetical protein